MGLPLWRRPSCKWADTAVDRSLRYFTQRFPECEAWQIATTGTKDYISRDGIRVAPAFDAAEHAGLIGDTARW